MHKIGERTGLIYTAPRPFIGGQHMGSRVMFAVIASAILCGCDGSSIPTAPPRCTTVTVFATEQWYMQRPEPEREFSGQLEFRNAPATPNGRDHRYFLANTAVYSGG